MPAALEVLYGDGIHRNYFREDVRVVELCTGDIVKCACYLAPAEASLSAVTKIELDPVVLAGQAAGIEEFYFKQLFNKCKEA